MRENNDPYDDDSYTERTSRSSDRDPYDDSTDSFPRYPTVPYGIGWGWPPIYRTDADEEGTDERYAEDEYSEDDGSWLDEGLIAVLLIVGVALFLFPEPGTSLVGIILITIGALAWIVDALT